ncbi:MAG: flagellar hook protein FlgE [Deltaproteobacteria bacterium]|nr:flagellar hook protein FlgE [Deltaproteobacteria bacterium]
MSIASSFYSALSGMNTNGIAMQVIADNISNTNTVGFKSTTIQFEDILGMSLEGIGGFSHLGVGANVSAMPCSFTQGTVVTTSVGTDLAVNGKGFFIVEDAITNEQSYTRAGNFHVDSDGYFVNVNNLRVQGYLYDASGTNLVETLNDIVVDQTNMIAPSTTEEVNMMLNLDSAEEDKTFDLADPGGTSNYSTALTIYDTLGQSHTITIYFTKTGDQAWEWNATIDGSDVDGGTPGTAQLFGTGDIGFTTDGLLSTAMPVDFYAGGITFSNGIAATDIEVDFSSTTQYGSPSIIQSLSQDGYAAGTLSGINITSEGDIVGHFTNGAVKNIARLALADFPSLTGLERAGSLLFKETTESGDPLVNKPGEGGLGEVAAGMLEESNVDLAAEFIRMIITQRAYQANSKVISTTDEMLAQLMTIK